MSDYDVRVEGQGFLAFNGEIARAQLEFLKAEGMSPKEIDQIRYENLE